MAWVPMMYRFCVRRDQKKNAIAVSCIRRLPVVGGWVQMCCGWGEGREEKRGSRKEGYIAVVGNFSRGPTLP